MLQDEGKRLMRAAMSGLNLSARAFDHILKLACTIADLAGVKRDQIGRQKMKSTCIWLLVSDGMPKDESLRACL